MIDCDFENCSPAEKENLTQLLKLLRLRLGEELSEKVTFKNDNENKLSEQFLLRCLFLSLSSFNSAVPFTKKSFGDSCFCNDFADILVQGAAIVVLSAKALEQHQKQWFYYTEGLSLVPPNISTIMMRQWEIETQNYMIKLNLVKMELVNKERT